MNCKRQTDERCTRRPLVIATIKSGMANGIFNSSVRYNTLGRRPTKKLTDKRNCHFDWNPSLCRAVQRLVIISFNELSGDYHMRPNPRKYRNSGFSCFAAALCRFIHCNYSSSITMGYARLPEVRAHSHSYSLFLVIAWCALNKHSHCAIQNVLVHARHTWGQFIARQQKYRIINGD